MTLCTCISCKRFVTRKSCKLLLMLWIINVEIKCFDGFYFIEGFFAVVWYSATTTKFSKIYYSASILMPKNCNIGLPKAESSLMCFVIIKQKLLEKAWSSSSRTRVMHKVGLCIIANIEYWKISSAIKFHANSWISFVIILKTILNDKPQNSNTH